MKTTAPLKENNLFRRAYSRGKTAANSCLALYIRRNGQKSNRLGLTISTKVGGAVVRNRIRRRLREIYRLHEDRLVLGRDVVIVALVRAASSDYHQLERSFLKLADKLGLLKKEGPQ